MTEIQSPTPHTADSILASDTGYDGFVRSLFNRSGDPSKDFAHAVLGIVTECNEYLDAKDRVHSIEEAGDGLFYITAMKQVLEDVYGDLLTGLRATKEEDVEAHFLKLGDQEDCHEVLRTQSVILLDIAKRWVGYGKAPAAESVPGLLLRCSCLFGFIVECGPLTSDDFDQVAYVNVEKLLERYNGIKFDAERAVNRDLVAERDVLERASA